MDLTKATDESQNTYKFKVLLKLKWAQGSAGTLSHNHGYNDMIQ